MVDVMLDEVAPCDMFGDVSIALSIAGLIEPPMLGNLSYQSVPIGQFSRGHIKEFKYGAALLKRSIYPSVPFQT